MNDFTTVKLAMNKHCTLHSQLGQRHLHLNNADIIQEIYYASLWMKRKVTSSHLSNFHRTMANGPIVDNSMRAGSQNPERQAFMGDDAVTNSDAALILCTRGSWIVLKFAFEKPSCSSLLFWLSLAWKFQRKSCSDTKRNTIFIIKGEVDSVHS